MIIVDYHDDDHLHNYDQDYDNNLTYNPDNEHGNDQKYVDGNDI